MEGADVWRDPIHGSSCHMDGAGVWRDPIRGVS